jgi:hypothetical protein
MTERAKDEALERTQAHEERLATIHAARDGAYMLALVGASVALALTSHGELAATALGGALALAVPRSASIPRVPPIALGMMFGAFVGLAG